MEREPRDIVGKLKAIPVPAHALALSLLGVQPLAVRARPKRFRACPACGNPTRGTAKVGDDRCAKCQADNRR